MYPQIELLQGQLCLHSGLKAPHLVKSLGIFGNSEANGLSLIFPESSLMSCARV